MTVSVSSIGTRGKRTPALFAFSFSHHQADLHLREQLKLDTDERRELLDALQRIPGLCSHVVLDTCNRWEVYGVALREGVVDQVWKCICDAFPVSDAELHHLVNEYRESRMIQHLFEVSAGVDSQMVGETEILGQVKAAYGDADEANHVDLVMHRIFNKAFQAAKWARTHTQIGRGQVSIGNITVDLATRIFGELSSCKVLVIGSGEVGRLTAQALRSRAARSLTFTSRTLEHAQLLATEMKGAVFAMEGLVERLPEFDIVVSSTASPQVLLSRETMKQVMRRRSFRPLFMIDLAMPRDIEPSVGKISQVFLYNLDDVSSIANENLESRSQEIDACKRALSARAWSTWLEVVRRQQMRKLRERSG